MKNKVILMVVFLLVVSMTATMVSANHNATVSWETISSEIWEFSENFYKFSVKNDDSDSVNTVSLNVSPLIISNFQDSVGNATQLNAFEIKWSSLVIDDATQNLNFDAIAPEVDVNETYLFEVELVDSNGTASHHNLFLNVLNDDILPDATLDTPSAHFIQRDGNREVNLSYVEIGSGLKNITVNYEVGNPYGHDTALVNENHLFFSDLFSGVATTNFSVVETSGWRYFKYKFNLTDKAGNSNIVGPFWIYIDNNVPQLSLDFPSMNQTITSDSANFGFNLDDDSLDIHSNFTPQVTCDLYIDSFLNATSNFTNNGVRTLLGSFGTISEMDDGYYTWFVNCTDLALWSNQTQESTFLLDRQGPEFVTAINNTVVNNNTDLIVNITDHNDLSGVKNVSVYVDDSLILFEEVNQTSGTYLYTFSSEILAYGYNNVTIVSSDYVSNHENVTYVVTMDNKPPVFDTLLPVDMTFSESNFFFNATDEYSPIEDPCELAINETQHNISLLTWKAVTLADGTYSWNITCSDNLGNTNTSQTRTVYVDNTVPSFDVHSIFEGVVNQDYIFVNVTLTELNPLTTNISLFKDGLLNATYSNTSAEELSFNFTSLADGNYAWNASSVDMAGNRNSTKTYNLVLDRTNPDVEIVSPLSTFVNSSDVFIIANVSDKNIANTTFTISNTSMNIAHVNASQEGDLVVTTFSNLSDGSYYFNATAVDLAGNTNTSSTFNLIVDTTAPTVSILEPTDAINVNNSLVDFTINYSDANDGVCEFYVNDVLNATSAPTNPVTFQYNFTESNNVYSWFVRCNDSAGNWYNVDGSSHNNTLYYDTTTPVFNPQINESNQPLVSVEPYQATFSWITSEETINTVQINNTVDITQNDSSIHANITATGLSENTAYPYRVWSCDQAGVAGDETHCVVSEWFFFSTTNDPSNDPSASSGSSSTSTSGGAIAFTSSCKENWSCSQWSSCEDGVQSRECTDINDCETKENKPNEQQSCTVDEVDEGFGELRVTSSSNDQAENETASNQITGAVTAGDGFFASNVPWFVIGFIGLVLLGFAAVNLYGRRKKTI